MMARFKVRWLVARRQKSHTLYYWSPPKSEQERWGLVPRRLATRTNLLGDAVNEASLLNREADDVRNGLKVPAVSPGTIGWLRREFERDPAFDGLSGHSRRFYSQNLDTIESLFCDVPAAKLTRQVGLDLYRKVYETGKHRKASAIMQALRRLYAFAFDHGYVQSNPFEKPRIQQPPSRTVLWSPEDVERLCGVAPPSVALAVRLAYELCQRQGDVLKMPWSAFDGESVSLRQSKTQRTIRVPVPASLRDALNAMPRVSPIIVVNETTGKPYDAHQFRKVFRKARRAASLSEDLKFLDLRRSGATELARAGATDDEIRSVTGHRTREIVNVYVMPDDKMAKAAIRKRQLHKKHRGKSGTKSAQS